MASALLDLEADTCGGCGLPYSETMAQTDEQRAAFEEGLAKFWEKNPDRDFFAGATECQGCKALHVAQRIARDDDEKAEKSGQKRYPQARIWAVWQRPKPED